MNKAIFPLCILFVLCLSAGDAMTGPIKNAPILHRGDLDCSNVLPIAPGETVTGSNVGAPSNVSTYPGCIDWGMNDGEVVYELTVGEDGVYDIDLRPDGCDLGLVLLSACDEYACIDGSDVWGDEHVHATLTAGVYYVVVDGYDTGNECPYELSVARYLEHHCDIVMDPSCDTDVTGSTSHGGYLTDPNVICGPTGHLNAFGREDWYALTVGTGASIRVELALDHAGAALWLLDDCVEPYGCLDYYCLNYTGALLFYTNTTGTDNEVYIVVDQNAPGTTGPYTLSLTCTGNVVLSDEASWGEIKVMYR